MQLGEARKGFSRQSGLFDSLKVYLDNKNRLQPIIGLGSIIECVKVDIHNREALYMCEVCICRLNKADMRNHIMGSLHRYNYIKAWHPHLVSEIKENSDLSKLAWPLMDIAKILERNEGPGDVQLLEVEDDVYQKIATCSENYAITLIGSLRDGQGDGEPESHLEAAAVHFDHYPSQSHRIVLLAQNQQRQSEKSSEAEMISHKIPHLLPPVKSDGWLKNIGILSEPSMLEGYTGTKPLIGEGRSGIKTVGAPVTPRFHWNHLQSVVGTDHLQVHCTMSQKHLYAFQRLRYPKTIFGLFRVVECKSEDGNTYCFLCHCCRIRSNKKDIIDHLTSSSHLLNYLMETHPDQVELVTTAVNDVNCKTLQSLAEKVEREEGRGELKVVNAPKSLCFLLNGKSYHWCIKMLCNGWTDSNSQQEKVSVKGPGVNAASEHMPEKHAVAPSKWEQKKKKKRRKKRRMANTVFKVSLPLTKGAVLLERSSFSQDNLHLSCAHAPPSNPRLIPSETQTDDFELDSDTKSFEVGTTSQIQQDLCNEDGSAGKYMELAGNFTVKRHGHSLDQEVDGYFGDNGYFYQFKDETVTRNQKVRAGTNYNKDEGLQTEGVLLTVSPTKDWTPYQQGYAEQWYNAAAMSKTGTGVEVSSKELQKKMSSVAAWHHYQQQPQYLVQEHASLISGNAVHHGLSGELVPRLDAAWTNMHPYLGGRHAHRASTAPDATTQFHEAEQRQLQTNTELTNAPTAPQSYMSQPAVCQVVQVGSRFMGDPGYNIPPRTDDYQHFPHAVSGGSGVGGVFRSNAYSPPWQTLCYGAHSDVNVRATGSSGLMISGRNSSDYAMQLPI